MKQNISLGLSLVAIILSIYTISSLKNPTESAQKKSHFGDKEEKTDEVKEIEIADLMEYIQTFHLKIYLSAKAGNDTLCNFYLHELGEKMNEISKASIWSHGVNISENIRIYGLKAVDALIDKDANFVFQNFENLTTACNSCHVASKHTEIVIKTPVNAEIPNQDFNSVK